MHFGNKLKILVLFVGDIIALYASLFITLVIRYGNGFFTEYVDAHATPFSIIFIFWILIFYIAGLYDLRRLRYGIDLLKTLALALLVNAILAVFTFYLIPAFGIAPKTNLLIFIAIFALIEMFWRRAFSRITASGEAPNRAILVGNGPVSEEIKSTLLGNALLGYTIVAEISEADAFASPQIIVTTAERTHANLVIVPRHLKHERTFAAALYTLLGRGVTVSDLVNFYELIMRKVPLAELEEAWFLENIAPGVRFYDSLKRAFELILAISVGVVLSPFELLIAVLVKLTSSGPVIYRQIRVGEQGKNFTLYKFRTMRMDAEKDGPQWASARDNRATPIGQFLRKSHLDELPQLWNILRGELSFVGPRPERPEFVAKLEKDVPYYDIRLLIKPGVTGWAQINYHKDATVEDVMQKLEYDVYYLKNRSIIIDLAIIVKTLKSFFVTPE